MESQQDDAARDIQGGDRIWLVAFALKGFQPTDCITDTRLELTVACKNDFIPPIPIPYQEW